MEIANENEGAVDIKLNESEDENIKEIFTENNNILKSKIKELKKYFNDIIKRLKNISIKIDFYFEEFENKEQEIQYDNGKFIGKIINGKREGKGTMFYTNGNKYEGDWENNKKEGKGKIFMRNGNKYEGNWENNKEEGKGIFYYNNGNKYEGDWKNGKFLKKGFFGQLTYIFIK